MKYKIRLTTTTYDEIREKLVQLGFFKGTTNSTVMKVGPIYFIRGT